MRLISVVRERVVERFWARLMAAMEQPVRMRAATLISATSVWNVSRVLEQLIITFVTATFKITLKPGPGIWIGIIG